MRTLSIVIVTGVLSTVFPQTAEACSCIADRPMCEQLWSGPRPPLVFEAPVAVIDSAETRDADGRFTRTRLIHLKDERGVIGTPVSTIATGFGGGDCGVRFEIGRRYLIHAVDAGDGRVPTTNTCMRTAPLDRATATMDYIRSLPDAPEGGWIGGRIKFDGAAPVAPALVSVTGPVARTVPAEADGRFRIAALPPGRYTVSIDSGDSDQPFTEPPTSLGGGSRPRVVDLSSPHACRDVSFWVRASP